MMGGRGAAAEKNSLNEYLGKRGLSLPISDYMLDKERNPHSLTHRQRVKLEQDTLKAAREYSDKRNAAIKEYNSKIASGELVKKSRIEVLIETAKGHPDNPSVMAARRTLEKRGIDWRTGRKREKTQ